MCTTECHPFQTQLAPHRMALRRFALKLTRHEQRAEDLVQETFLKAWAARSSFCLGTDLRGWLFTILRNAFYSDLRKYRREVADVDGKLAAQLSEEAAQEHAVALNELIHAISVLPEIYRRPLVLMGVYGFSQLEAASACGCTVGTIKSRVSRVRATLNPDFGISDAAAAAPGSVPIPPRVWRRTAVMRPSEIAPPAHGRSGTAGRREGASP
jgi:RNA polymerase sigma-70 factor (ECF subfamily)